MTTSYIVASTTVVPLAGAVADIYGWKWLYTGGLIVFLIGSVLAGFADSMNALIAYRAVQGLGAGVMMAMAFVTIGDLFPPAERAKYQGLIAGVFGISSVIGPTLGGFLTDSLSWNWIFFVNLPLGIPVVFLFIKLFPNRKPTRARTLENLRVRSLSPVARAAETRRATGEIAGSLVYPQISRTHLIHTFVALAPTETRCQTIRNPGTDFPTPSPRHTTT